MQARKILLSLVIFLVLVICAWWAVEVTVSIADDPVSEQSGLLEDDTSLQRLPPP